ncbi:hypothetical protein D3C71_2031120 [compost metagenome]
MLLKAIHVIVDPLLRARMGRIDGVGAVQLRQRIPLRIAQHDVAIGVLSVRPLHRLVQIIAPVDEGAIIDAGFLTVSLNMFDQLA